MIVGVAGCGQMGRPMAEALQAAGFTTRGFDIRPPSDFAGCPVAVTDDIAAFADGLECCLTVVRDISQTEALLFDDQRLLARAGALHTLIVCSTLSPRWLSRLPARLPAGMTLIDAPMSGAPIAASERTLSFMLGGPDDALDGLMPLFRAMGTKLHRLGGTGAGMTAKVLNNMVAAANLAACRAAFAWAEASGLGREALIGVLNDSSGQNWYSANFDRISFSREGYDPANTMGIIRKDVASALDAAPDGADTDLAEAVIRAIERLTPID